MKLAIYVLPLALSLGLALPAAAQDDPAKDQPANSDTAKQAPAHEEGKDAPPAEEKKDEAAKNEAAKEAPPAGEAAKESEKPAAEPTAAHPAEAAAAPAAAPAAAAAAPKEAQEKKPAAEAAPSKAAAPAKELSSTAKSFMPIADSYKAAHDDMLKWIDQINTQTSAASDKVNKLQKQIQDNEAAITQAKLANDKAKVKDLTNQNKKNWDELNVAKKSMSEMFNQYAKEASTRVKQYGDSSGKALEAVRSQGK